MSNHSNLNPALWCPQGFVFPDHPNDVRNEWFGNTSCAIACISPLYTLQTYAQQELMIQMFSWVGLVALSMLLITHLHARKLSYLVKCTVHYCFVLSLSFVCFSYYSIEDKFCHDNAIPKSMSDGPSLCMFEGFVCAYTGVGIVYAWYGIMKSFVACW